MGQRIRVCTVLDEQRATDSASHRGGGHHRWFCRPPLLVVLARPRTVIQATV